MQPIFDYNVFPNILLESHFEFNGEDFLHFPEGVEFYSLFRGNKKINSFQELMYIGEVLMWLNPELEYEAFIAMMMWVSDRDNGRSIRTYSEKRVVNGCQFIWDAEKKPYVNKYRKIIFNPSKRIPREDKLAIVGTVISRGSITEEKVYDVVEELMCESEPITINLIAKVMKVTRQTISRHITASIKEIVWEFNQSLYVK